MKHTKQWLIDHNMDFSSLSHELGISVKDYGDRVVLNYSQIESPKTHPVVRECRGAIMSKSGEVICRPFDRFYNLGEAPETQKHLDINRTIAVEKLDGSLIKLYHWNGSWELATRGSAFGENEVFDHGITFRQLALQAFGLTEEEFQRTCSDSLQENVTYLFELTSPLNRVVTPYNETSMWFLGGRSNTHEDGQTSVIFYMDTVKAFLNSVRLPAHNYFSSLQETVTAANSLGGLQEGWVLWQDGLPVCKVKAEAYVTAHRIREEGLTAKRICELVLMNEHDEYLAYFPQEREFFEPYYKTLFVFLELLECEYNRVKNIIDQKEFAIAVKELPYASALFSARKTGKSVVQCFHDSRMEWKVGMLKDLVKE